MNKTRATKITIESTEAAALDTGATIEGGNVWAKMDALLTILHKEYRRTGGRNYAKTRFTVTYEDGETYQGRIDLGDSHQGEGNQCLGKHINAFIAYALSERSWVQPAGRAELAEFRENYEIGA